MRHWSSKFGAAGAFMLSLLCTPVLAGPEDGVLTVALAGPVEAVDIYMGPGPEVAMTANAVFNPLVAYDTKTRSYQGVIAESWKRVDDETMEFHLRPGLVFQDGSALDAEDVAYTINFISNPETRFRLKTRYASFAGAKVVDPLTVRVSTRGPFPMLMARMIGIPIYPSDSHAALGADYANWGRAPIGSGPYRVVGFDEATGIVMERWDEYQLGPLPDFKRIVFRPVKDRQTQMAEMMAGNVDVIVASSPDQVAALTALPGFQATVIPDMLVQYMYLDAAGRSGIEAFQDPRVRQAVFHAIDREAIRKNIISGGKEADELLRLCLPYQIGCPEGGVPQTYDPDRARALLTEAGYGDGFDLQVSTWGPSRPIAEAVVGYLRAVGIRANVDALTLGAYRKKQVEGGLQALVSSYPYGGLPDTGVVVDFFFGSPARDYYGNPKLVELTAEANSILDEDKRADLFRETLDLVEKDAYILPISSDPAVIIHTDAVSVDPSPRGDVLFAQFSLFETYGDVPAILGWAH
ncbi:ABC transporter substrate-binding protein [uncultured Roseibium sp.]|uniref:ABC transporter substrate-binding protein n=1 Tax=uncultured Roseibium sp. TaxID=1936171 RepID=UPI0032166FD0